MSWYEQEDNPSNLWQYVGKERRIRRGTTLAIDWDTKIVRARLTTERHHRQRLDYDRWLKWLLDHKKLKVGAEAPGTGGAPLSTAIIAEVKDGVMCLRATAQMLQCYT